MIFLLDIRDAWRGHDANGRELGCRGILGVLFFLCLLFPLLLRWSIGKLFIGWLYLVLLITKGKFPWEVK